MSRSRITRLEERVQRIDCCGMHVDMVATSEGTVRVGSMPDIAKFLTDHGFREEIVVVPEWEVSAAGDNRTGEEFVLWQAQVRGGIRKKYVGLADNVLQLEKHLGRIFPYYFDSKCLSIVRKRWLGNWFGANPVDDVFRSGELEIHCSPGSLVLYDRGRLIYDRAALQTPNSSEDDIEALLAEVGRDQAPHDRLEVIPIGCGNGLNGIVANTIVRFDKYVIWIDPCGYPAQTLARHGIHWDDVTHLLFTHNHEDHVQGFSACLQRARASGRRLKLIAAGSVYRLLAQSYAPLFPDLGEHVQVFPLMPGTPLDIGPVRIESRWNHHILPYGTVGLRLTAGDRCFGYSGDTKYDERINSILNRAELTPAWFSNCDLVFHEIDFNNPHSVHSHWKQVEALQREISGRVLGYHTPFLANSPFELVVEGHCYAV